MSWSKQHKYNIAVFMALLFHISGAIGLFTNSRDWFVQLTPLNLLLMAGLLLWTQYGRINNGFITLFCLCFATGMAVETIGVHTGWLFGHYQYGPVLGAGWNGIPFLIGVNWFILVYGAGTITRNIPAGALIVTLFDWLMEPVAVKLNFWTWLGDGNIPLYNYVCWFAVAALLLTAFTRLPIERNKFAVALLVIQSLFFACLRIFL